MRPIIRKISFQDNFSLSKLIRTVMPEFGASGEGFAIHDREVDDMYAAYLTGRSVYYVCEEDGIILGGGGVAPLAGGPEDTCELKKMYFLPAGRGRGLGQEILNRCMESARDIGFKYCYLETFNTMKGAMTLYERNVFKKIPGSRGNTGHFACDTFYQKEL